MEDPDGLLCSVLSWAEQDGRVDAIIQTGSRARGRRVDAFSDLDIELIGPNPAGLAADDTWIRSLGEVLVMLPLENDEPGGLGWPTRLVVFEHGRKVDFLLAGWPRIWDMVASGLNDLYNHGYLIHFDQTGDAAALPASDVRPPEPAPPTQQEFSQVEREYWFEATQVAVYLARRDLWVVKHREQTMRADLLRMLEWLAQSDPAGNQYTWHLGHHMHEWLPAARWQAVQQVFTHFDVDDTLRGLTASMTLFEEVSATVASRHRLTHREDLPRRVRSHVETLTRTWCHTSS